MNGKRFKWFPAVLSAAVSLGLFVSCAQTKTATMATAEKGDKIYTEEELGLRHETLYTEDNITPVHGETTTKEPGESTKFERSFENSPPLIAHDITGMLPLERDNICMGCHMPEEAVFSGATPIPSSHLINLTTGEYLRGKLDGSRFNCLQCHVVQTALTPAVENIFKGEFRDKQGRYRSNLLNLLNEGVNAE
ncbi:MAG: nitrate reductase [Nitrospiraceae bacterium]|nr:MAG: nitrate reductase [Nitrospiraceae bacterium]